VNTNFWDLRLKIVFKSILEMANEECFDFLGEFVSSYLMSVETFYQTLTGFLIKPNDKYEIEQSPSQLLNDYRLLQNKLRKDTWASNTNISRNLQDFFR